MIFFHREEFLAIYFFFLFLSITLVQFSACLLHVENKGSLKSIQMLLGRSLLESTPITD